MCVTPRILDGEANGKWKIRPDHQDEQAVLASRVPSLELAGREASQLGFEINP